MNRSRLLIWIGVALGVVVVSGLLFFLLMRKSAPQPSIPQAPQQQQTEDLPVTDAGNEVSLPEEDPVSYTFATSSLLPDPALFEDDQDRDGVDDAKEQKVGTSNQHFDTDGDGLSDKAEIDVWKTDPTVVDSDGDGYGDGFEVINGYNPAGPGPLEE